MSNPKKLVKKSVKPSSVITEVTEQQCKIGCLRQRTINLGDYESVRVGYWMERTVTDDEDVVKREYEDMVNTLDEMLLTDIIDAEKGG